MPEGQVASAIGDDQSVSVGRDASGNAFVTGDNNRVKVIIYQAIAQQRQHEEPRSTEIGPNPYMGLLAFHELDAGRFFGRRKQITRLWEKLRDLHQDSSRRSATHRFLSVLGPSGSGKSSVARAGLIPELARHPLPGFRDVRIAVLTPSSHPIESLAGTLARIATGDSAPVAKTREFKEELNLQGKAGHYDGLRRIADALPEIAAKPLILLIDQFEEIYSLCDDKQERAVFVENLLHAASDIGGRASVVITLRTDFLGETHAHEVLNRVICEQQVMIPALNEEELRDVIASPAASAGHPLDDATITLLVNDAKDREGALPLLQFALTRIWDGLTQGVAPSVTYQKIGGVGGAIAGEAERIYDGLADDQKRIAKRLFLGLVQLGEGMRDTRRRAPVAELVSAGETPSEVEQVIRRFAGRDARLVTLSADQRGKTETAEVTHEALFTNWKKLAEWLEENRDDIRLSRRLDEEARNWERQGRPHGSLWRPPNLELLRQFYSRMSSDMNSLQIEFYERSTNAESWRRTRRWVLVTVFSAAFIMTLWLAYLAVTSRDKAIQAYKALIDKQIDNLQTATPDGARDIVKDLKEQSKKENQIEPTLRARLEKGDLSPGKEARIRLGILVVADDREQIQKLSQHMLSAPLDEFLLLRDTLRGFQDTIHKRQLWADLREERDRSKWFRAAVLLAAVDPKNAEWKQVGVNVAEDLIRQDPGELTKWIDPLRPVGEHILPRLEEAYISTHPDRAAARPNAAIALAEIATPVRCAELVVNYADSMATFRPLISRLQSVHASPSRQYPTIPDAEAAGALKFFNDVVLENPPLRWPLKKGSPAHDILSNRDSRLLSRQANAAVCLFMLKDTDRLLKLLESDAHTDLRTYIIHRLPQLGVSTERFIPHLINGGQSAAVRQALILALGTYPPEPVSDVELATWKEYLLHTFTNDPDPGVHSAAEWTLNQWKRDSRLKDLNQQLEDMRKEWAMNGRAAGDRRRWYVNKVGQTMIQVAKPGRIEIGSPSDELGHINDEDLHDVAIDWAFSISATEIIVPDLIRMANDEVFVKEFQSRIRDEDLRTIRKIKESMTTENQPAMGISWFLAAAYCNWLSRKDGLEVEQWCYEVDKQTGKYWAGMTIRNLSTAELSGYRLPLEAEWEYACRAGTRTRWSCGHAQELLSHYARCTDNCLFPASSLMAGGLKPNNWGLFDMHGGACEWCQDAYQERFIIEIPLKETVTIEDSRVLRGGSFNYDAGNARSACRRAMGPGEPFYEYGFRVARTHH